MRLLDRDFRYIPSAHTDIAATWRRFGFRPTTETERRARQQRVPAEISFAPVPSGAGRSAGSSAKS